MKVFRALIILLGVVCLLAGAVGFFSAYQAAQEAGVSMKAVDSILALGSAFGIQSEMTLTEQLVMTTITYRVELLIAGGVALVLGALMRKKS